MGITESLWLIICVSFILAFYFSFMVVYLISKSIITLYKKYSNDKVRLTPFEAAGYTKETKFKVLRDRGILSKGDIVTLLIDDGSLCLWFKTEDGRLGWSCLPNMAPKGSREHLEVYEEPKADFKLRMKEV